MVFLDRRMLCLSALRRDGPQEALPPLRAQGLSVRVERAVPEGLKAREIREVV